MQTVSLQFACSVEKFRHTPNKKRKPVKTHCTKLVYYDISKKRILLHQKMDRDSVLIVSGLKENVCPISSKTLNEKITSLTESATSDQAER